jgi:alkyl hydroperoxide reductase subunit AhpF
MDEAAGLADVLAELGAPAATVQAAQASIKELQVLLHSRRPACAAAQQHTARLGQLLGMVAEEMAARQLRSRGWQEVMRLEQRVSARRCESVLHVLTGCPGGGSSQPASQCTGSSLA